MKDIGTILIFLVVLAFSVMGFIEWLKALVAAIKTKKNLLYVILNCVLSISVGILTYFAFPKDMVNVFVGIIVGLVVLAFIELIGYNVIVKFIKSKLGISTDQSTISDSKSESLPAAGQPGT